MTICLKGDKDMIYDKNGYTVMIVRGEIFARLTIIKAGKVIVRRTRLYRYRDEFSCFAAYEQYVNKLIKRKQ